MKILFVATQISGNGGIPRFTKNFISQLKGTPNTFVKIVSLNDTEREYSGAGKSKIKFILTLIRLLITYRPDQVVIAHLNFVKLARFKFLAPSSYWHVVLHGVEAWVLRAELTRFYSKINRFWAVSSYTKRTFSKTNAVALDKIKIVLLTTSSDWDLNIGNVSYSPFFLSVSRLEKSEGYKGVDKTIEAIYRNKLAMKALGYAYVVVGNGDDLHRHIDLVNTYKLNDIVTIKTAISEVELKDLYRTTSCSILPSSGEGFGFIFLEAMAYKKAVIGCKNCGSEDLIEHGKTGYLVDPTVEDIWKHMKLLMENPVECKKMGDAGYWKREKEYKGDRTERNIEELLCVE